MRRTLALLAACLAAPAFADLPHQLPPPQETSVDFGIGLGALRFPAYTGASDVRSLLLPFPYVVVHSQFLDVDRNRVRGKLLKDDRFAIDADFAGGVSVTSDDTRERQGMPDLDWLGEAGPALRYHAWHRPDEEGVDFVLPVRVAASVRGLGFHHRGYTLDPRAEWHKSMEVRGDAVTVDSSFTVPYFDKTYSAYYYSVAPQYVTPTRQAYDAPGGYAGWRWELGFSWHHGEMVYGAFIEHTSLHGARFQSSPLVGSADGTSLGLAVSWVFHHQ